MVTSALQAVASIIDSLPQASIFGLDVIRGTFLVQCEGAMQFWVQICKKVGGLDFIMISSNGTTGSGGSQQQPPDQVAENFLSLSPCKGRDNTIMNTPLSVPTASEYLRNNNVGKRKRKSVLYSCNPNMGLVEVVTGMGLTSGDVGGGNDDEDKEP